MLRSAPRGEDLSVLGLIGASACAEARQGLRVGEQLRAQLILLAGGAGTVRVHTERAWNSPTFAGTRHNVHIRFEGDDVAGGEAMMAAAPGHEFSIPGQLVADVVILDVDHRVLDERLTVTVEALLLEDD